MRFFLAVIVGLLGFVAVASAAAGGGFATAGLAPPPDDLRAGEAWVARVTLLQHGRTPLTGVSPTVSIVNDETGERRAFPARETDAPGVYEARVELPSAGTWRYEVDDDFSQRHTFAPFDVSSRAPGGFPLARAAVAAAAALAAVALAAFAVARLRRGRAVPALR